LVVSRLYSPTSCFASWIANGFSRNALIRLNTAVFAPIPRARTEIAATLKSGLLTSIRSP
jgi:hypothetical protein